MYIKSCFFIGHREITGNILPKLEREIDRHINELGVNEFFVGNYGEFDRMVAHLLKLAKKHYPQITLSLLTPYHPSERRIVLPDDFDFAFYPSALENVPRRFAIVRANKYKIDHSDYLIAYVWHTASNARNILEYAQRRENEGKISISLI